VTNAMNRSFPDVVELNEVNAVSERGSRLGSSVGRLDRCILSKRPRIWDGRTLTS
jgi:hypothetical protein